MPGIKLKDHEPFEVAIRRFKRLVEKSGVLSELRRREYYESGSERRKRAKAAAVKRFRKKQSREGKGEREKGGGRAKASARSNANARTGSGAMGRSHSDKVQH